MIFETQNQLYCFFIFLFFGIVLGIISIIYFLFTLLNFQKKLLKNIFLTVFYAIFSVFFVFFINFFNFGKFEVAPLIAYLIGFIWIKTLFKNLLVILENKWYNTLKKIFKTKLRKQKNNEISKKN